MLMMLGIHPRFLVPYYRSELTNVNTALDKDTYQCTICKEKLYLKDPAQIREHPKLKVIICRVSIRHTCSKHNALSLKSDLKEVNKGSYSQIHTTYVC